LGKDSNLLYLVEAGLSLGIVCPLARPNWNSSRTYRSITKHGTGLDEFPIEPGEPSKSFFKIELTQIALREA